MAEKKQVAIGLGLAALGIIIVATMAKAAPPEGYVCPHCGVPFDTYEQLLEHVQTAHPGARIPIDIDWK